MPLISEFPIAGPQGKQGPIGPQGKQGPEGKRGPMGPAGPGTGDMLAMVYDPQGKAIDVYKYTDDAAAGRADLTLSNLSNKQKALRNIGGRPNQNLLDNWYFAGGGSQQGDGQFPINQRGETSYNSFWAGVFDRWMTSSAVVDTNAISLNLTISCLEMSVTDITDNMNSGISQVCDNSFAGNTLTASILIKDCTGQIHFLLCDGYWNYYADMYITTPGLHTFTFSIPEDKVNRVRLAITSNIIQTLNAEIIAVKLELGDHQTLAYQDEDGNWQLFETPDYAEELAKCQRYLFNPLMGGLEWSQIMYGYAYSDTKISCTLTLPVNMRTLPAIVQSGGFRCVGAGIVLKVTGFNVVDCSGNTIRIDVSVSGAKASEVYVFMRDNDSASKLLLSAEL